MFLRLFLVTLLFSLQTIAAELAPVFKQRFFDANGEPLAGGKLYSYEAGSLTPKVTYNARSAIQANENANPVILDANGEADVWIGSGYYKFILKDSSDVTQWTKDQVSLPSEAALASAFWRDVIYITSADSPYTITSAMNGKLISVDTTSGAVTINLPEISSLTLPWNVGVKIDTYVNSVTINRAGTDTIGGASTKVLSSLNAGVQLIGAIGKSPDDWNPLDIGTVADGAVSRDKLATGAVAVPNRRTVAGNATVLTTDDELYITAEGTVTLLAANTSGARPVRIFNAIAAGGNVTVTRSGSDTIWDETSQILYNKNDNFIFIPDGTSKYNVGF